MSKMKKSRTVDNPWEIWVCGDWTWKVLKSYQNDNTKQYARAFCAVESPYTFGGYDMGDVYWSEITSHAVRIYRDPELED